MSGRRQWSLTLDVITCGALAWLVCFPVWPGVFTIDSQAIYDGAISDDVDTWYAPTLGWFWGIADQWGMPPAGVLVLGVTAVIGALLAFFRLFSNSVIARLSTIVTVLWPPVYGMLGWVGRDVWFLALTIAFLAALGWAAKAARWRWHLVAVAGVLAWFAQDARQNGLPVLAVWGGIAAWWALPPRWWRWVLVPLAAIAAVAVGSLLRLGVIAAIDADRVYPEQYLYYRDLLAVSIAVDEPQVPVSLFPSQNLDAVRQFPHLDEAFAGREAVVRWQPFESGGRVTAAVRDAWWAMVLARPGDYLQARARLYVDLTSQRPLLSAYFGVSDELDDQSRQFRQQFPEWNGRRLEVLTASTGERPGVGGLLHIVWPYLVVGLLGSIVLATLSGPFRVIGLTTLILQTMLQGALFFLAPTNQWRFELFQVVLGLAIALAAVAAVWSRLRTRGTPSASGIGEPVEPTPASL